jgi:hypothetical protein
MRPASITTMRSAWRTVARRCAITSVVRLHQALQRILHQPLAFGIQRAGGLVEQQDRRIAQNGAGNGDALALAARQARAVLARNVSALRAIRAGSFRHWRRGRRPRSPRRGVPVAIAQIVARAGGKQHAFPAPARCAGGSAGSAPVSGTPSSLIAPPCGS